MKFFAELKRRNVIKVAIAYIVVGWLIMQAGEVMGPALNLPDWVNSMLAFFLILGFPLAMIFAWAFEMTPDGIKKEKDVDRTQSITLSCAMHFEVSEIVPRSRTFHRLASSFTSTEDFRPLRNYFE